MPSPEHTLALVALGFRCGRLIWTGNDQVGDVQNHLSVLTGTIAVSFPEYAAEAEKLTGVMQRLEIDLTLEKTKPTNSIDLAYAKELNTLVNGLLSKVYRQREGQQVVTIQMNDTIEKLKKLRETLKNESQQNMADDTIRCLQAGAYRAATVMAWCLTFDYFRRWIFSRQDRLAEFNKQLTSMHKNKSANKLHDPIQKYEDFEEHGESFIIEVANQANMLDKTPHRVLTNALSDRNHFAHPTSRLSTPASAIGYVDGLLANVLTSPNFKYRQSKD